MRTPPKNILTAGPRAGLLRIFAVAAYELRDRTASVEGKPASITYTREEKTRAA